MFNSGLLYLKYVVFTVLMSKVCKSFYVLRSLKSVVGVDSLDKALGLIVFMIGLFALCLLWSLYKVYETKNKLYYIPSGFFCSVIVGFLFVGLGQYFGFVIMIIAGFIVLLLMSKLTTLNTLNVNDASGSLQFKDVFSWYFIPKLERLYGEFKAKIIFMTIITGIGGAVTFLMALLEIITFPIAGLLTIIIFASTIPLYNVTRDPQKGRFG